MQDKSSNGQKKQYSLFASEVCELTAVPNRLRPWILITEGELLEITEFVKMSEFFEASKVHGMDISLLRELIG